MATRKKGSVVWLHKSTELMNININTNFISYTKPLTYFTYIWEKNAYEKKNLHWDSVYVDWNDFENVNVSWVFCYCEYTY